MRFEERAIVDGLRAGQEEAFTALLDLYGAKLYNFAHRMCRHAEDARDVVQETFLALVRSLQAYRGEGSLQAWLFQIAANACRKMRRKRKFAPEEEISLEAALSDALDLPRWEIPDRSPDPESHLLYAELRTVLERAIAALPVKYRAVLLLRDVSGLSTEETARALGLTPQTVKTRLHRARLFLRERLAPYLHLPPEVLAQHPAEGRR